MVDNGRAWFAPLRRTLGASFGESLFYSFFINLLALAAPIFVLQVYDRVVFYAGLNTLTALAVGMAVVLFFDFLLRTARSRLMQRAALRIDVTLSRLLFAKLGLLHLRDLEARPAAYWQALFRDIETVRNTLAGPIAVLFADLPFAVLFILVIGLIATPLLWVMVLLTGIFVLLALVSGRMAAGAGEREKTATVRRDGLTAEIVAGRAGLKAIAGHDALAPPWEERQADVIEAAVRRGGSADTLHNFGYVLTVGTTVALTSIGALAIVEQTMTVGSLIAANMLANRVIGPMAQLVASWKGFIAYRQSMARLHEALSLPEERRAPVVDLPRPKGDIVAENVSFSFAGSDKPVLDSLKLRFAPATLTAIIGPNGSGKTTLLKVIAGLYPPSIGRVLIDGADTLQLTRAQLADWIGYVPQEPFLVSGSIRDNIALGRKKVSDEAIIAAAASIGLHQLVVDLPDGYATDVGESGARLSGGLRQRIGIARALVGNPPILLLDEPTSSLDRGGEDALREVLIALAAERTILVVTHSPALLNACGQILMLQHGRFAMGGPAADVLQRLSPTARVAGRATT